jgi:site-specific recombinase XerD
MKKTDEALIGYLTREEMQALINAPDPRTKFGARDRAMLHLAFAAGLRVSELISLRLDHVEGRACSSIHVMGKGRRERVLPLWKKTATTLRAWLAIRAPNGCPELLVPHSAGVAQELRRICRRAWRRVRAGRPSARMVHTSTVAASAPQPSPDGAPLCPGAAG